MACCVGCTHQVVFLSVPGMKQVTCRPGLFDCTAALATKQRGGALTEKRSFRRYSRVASSSCCRLSSSLRRRCSCRCRKGSATHGITDTMQTGQAQRPQNMHTLVAQSQLLAQSLPNKLLEVQLAYDMRSHAAHLLLLHLVCHVCIKVSALHCS
jgi:hypothetical protein